MSDYLEQIIDDFDPIEETTPSKEEMENSLPDDPNPDEILEASKSIRHERNSGGAVLTWRILGELLYLSQQVDKRIDEMEKSGAPEWNQDQKDDVHLFFAFVGQAQEYLLRQAVVTHVISDEARTDKMKEKIISNDRGRAMPAGECLDYLHRAGFIGDGLKGEIGQTRDERNEAVHDIRRWLFAQYDTQDLETQIRRGERSVVRLLELVYGFDLE